MRRRKFLGFLAASPIAAQSVAKNALVQTGFSVGGTLPAALNSIDVQPSECSPSAARTPLNLLRKLAKSLGNGEKLLPAWKEIEVQERAANFTGIDPDLAAMVSVSTSYKIRTQKKRNIELCRKQAIARLYQSEERNNWEQKVHKEIGQHIHWY